MSEDTEARKHELSFDEAVRQLAQLVYAAHGWDNVHLEIVIVIGHGGCFEISVEGCTSREHATPTEALVSLRQQFATLIHTKRVLAAQALAKLVMLEESLGAEKIDDEE